MAALAVGWRRHSAGYFDYFRKVATGATIGSAQEALRALNEILGFDLIKEESDWGITLVSVSVTVRFRVVG